MRCSVIKKIVVLGALGIFLTPYMGSSQEIELKFLYKQWRFKNVESADEFLILRSPHAARNDYNGSYGSFYVFEKGNDTIIYKNRIKNYHKTGGYCGFGKVKITLGEETEVWIIDKEGNKLRYDVYLEPLENNGVPSYSAFYKIVKIKRDYLKLQLENELFEGS